MTNFSKSDLARAVAVACTVSKSQAEEILTATFAVIREETAGGKVVNIPGFGKFVEKVREAAHGSQHADRRADRDRRTPRAVLQAQQGESRLTLMRNPSRRCRGAVGRPWWSGPDEQPRCP